VSASSLVLLYKQGLQLLCYSLERLLTCEEEKQVHDASLSYKAAVVHFGQEALSCSTITAALVVFLSTNAPDI